MQTDLTAFTPLSRSFDASQRRHSRHRRAESAHAHRAKLVDLPSGQAEDLRTREHEPTDEQWCDVFQVCLPYRGFGVWHVEHEDVIIDANQVIFVRAGEAYRCSGPVAGGYAELIITPGISVFAELLGEREDRLFEHALFRGRTVLASTRTQALGRHFLHLGSACLLEDPLAAEEAMAALVREVVRDAGCVTRIRTVHTYATARLITRTKRYLAEHLAKPLRLSGIGREVGASPAHLTTVFTRHEGLSLHQYLTRLRLASALAELPHADDLSALGLRVGFASHSHFTASFRRAYGRTPSDFRRKSRTAARFREAIAIE